MTSDDELFNAFYLILINFTLVEKFVNFNEFILGMIMKVRNTGGKYLSRLDSIS